MNFRPALVLLFILVPSISMAQALDGEPNNVEWVGYQQLSDGAVVFVRTTEKVNYRINGDDTFTIGVMLENTSIPVKNNRRVLDTQFFKSAVVRVHPRVIEGASPSVRIDITLKSRVPYEAIQTDNVLSLFFEAP